MTKDTIYLKSGDAFIIMWEDSVEIVQPDGNSCKARRVAENKSLVELTKRTPDEVKEIAERYEKSWTNVNNMITQFKQSLNTMTPKRKQDVTTVCNVPKFHGPDGDKLAEAVTLELGEKTIRIFNEGEYKN